MTYATCTSRKHSYDNQNVGSIATDYKHYKYKQMYSYKKGNHATNVLFQFFPNFIHEYNSNL